ncbi:MAG: CBASS cGAMP-activated phospholipase [Chlorobium phaeovibrioides]|nr:CBASS cGAMP-activated phospholipase [Chlorobium phaeovibrioides]
MGKPFRILSIDGGGIRGVYPAHFLRCIEERLEMDLFEKFDMIAGTSTGSIIAAGVATGVPAADMVAMYKEHGAGIFRKKRFFLPVKNVQPLFDSVYDAQYLENVLAKVFQDKRLGDLEKPLLLPSTDIGNACVRVLKSGYSKEFTRDNTVLVKDAVLASCSAPTYFDPHRLNEYLIADGGLWANNPALAAVIDAQKRLGVVQDDIQILSIGTGHSKTMYGTNASRKWGLINGWKNKEFISFILSLQSQSTLNYLNLMLRPGQIKRVDFESDLPLTLDDVSMLDDLISKADHNFTHESESIRAFIQNGGIAGE